MGAQGLISDTAGHSPKTKQSYKSSIYNSLQQHGDNSTYQYILGISTSSISDFKNTMEIRNHLHFTPAETGQQARSNEFSKVWAELKPAFNSNVKVFPTRPTHTRFTMILPLKLPCWHSLLKLFSEANCSLGRTDFSHMRQ